MEVDNADNEMNIEIPKPPVKKRWEYVGFLEK
jgi:hypothetical protein